MKTLVLLGLALATLSNSEARAQAWEGEVPSIASDREKWTQLTTSLMERKAYLGAMAASQRMLLLFEDVPTKTLAYQTLVTLADLGYPHSILESFLPGNLEPDEASKIYNDYHFYKARLNQTRSIKKWSDFYFDKIDKEHFHKYLFYRAIESYQDGDLDGAITQIKAILAPDSKLFERQDNHAFVLKAAQTLARIHFEKEEYKKSLDIYENFLLRASPQKLEYWLEAAWNLYYLKQYKKSLGFLYNLESKKSTSWHNLEKYILRALIHKEYCNVDAAVALVAQFNKDFDETIYQIVTGEMLTRLPFLKNILVPEAIEFQRISYRLQRTQEEYEQVDSLSTKIQALAEHLYKTEIRILEQKRGPYEEKALQSASSKLVLLNENLRFLVYDVEREKYNPDAVFGALIEDKTNSLFEVDEKTYKIKWIQDRAFWRDEKLKYRGIIEDKCLL